MQIICETLEIDLCKSQVLNLGAQSGNVKLFMFSQDKSGTNQTLHQSSSLQNEPAEDDNV